MEKLDRLTSADIVSQNIETLKQLFPTIVKEGQIDMEELKALLTDEAIVSGDEYYRFTWAGKAEARAEANKASTATLRPDKASSKDWYTTGNIFIEGDNLEVLKLLQKSYSNKIKMIYIDPPYNTGKDFVYKDNYKDNLANYLEQTGQLDDEGRKTSTNSESDGRYHSNWLNMMYPRLLLARNLMTEDGVIFISIDDNEQANLKKLCDEVFGEENFVADLIWQKKFARSNDATFFSTMHDYIICYCKNNILQNPQGWNIGLLPRSEEMPKGYSNPDNDFRGVWTSVVLSAKSGTSSLLYEIQTPSGRICTPPSGRYWSVNKDRFKELLDDNRIWFGKDGDGIPRLKTFLSEVQDGLRANTILFHAEAGHNQEGKQETKALFNNVGVFDSPKPVRLLEKLITIGNTSDSFILDFFAGSGTTAHAVMQLNAEDGGNRKCISVQLPEPTDENSEAYKAGYSVISDITKERIRRAGEKIKADYKDKEGIDKLDVGFKAFRLDSSNIRAWDSSKDALEQQLDLFVQNNGDNIKGDRTQEDVMYEVLLKYGLDLSIAIEERKIANTSVYNIGYGSLFICLADKITTAVAEGIGAWKEELEPATCRVIFKDTGFGSDADKTNSMQILKRFHISEVATI